MAYVNAKPPTSCEMKARADGLVTKLSAVSVAVCCMPGVQGGHRTAACCASLNSPWSATAGVPVCHLGRDRSPEKGLGTVRGLKELGFVHSRHEQQQGK